MLIAAAPIFAAVLDRVSGGEKARWQADSRARDRLLPGWRCWPVRTSAGSTWPIIEVLLVALCYPIAPLIAARRLADVPALPMTAVCLTFAAAVYAAPAVATWPDAWPSTRVLLALAALGVICTALAFIVFFALIREVGAARALVFTYVNPAVALAAGVIVLDEPLTVWNVGALTLILAGCVLATRRHRGHDRDRSDHSRRAAVAIRPRRRRRRPLSDLDHHG